jgi:hypothetical protein
MGSVSLTLFCHDYKTIQPESDIHRKIILVCASTLSAGDPHITNMAVMGLGSFQQSGTGQRLRASTRDGVKMHLEEKVICPADKVLTVGIRRGCPNIDFSQPGAFPKLRGFLRGVFPTLFNLNPLSLSEQDIVVLNIDLWDAKGFVTTSFMVEDILADDFPVFDVESFLAKDIICVNQAV